MTANTAGKKLSKASKPNTARGTAREICETIAFVVTLVLLLKMFVVEAFVIPTGSMAETLYGYQKEAVCPECGFAFPVNSSTEVEPPDELFRTRIAGACCPNCRHRFVWDPRTAPYNRSGDRVLVHKAIYNFQKPAPGDVVVFKYPVDPQYRQTAQNYIKRLWGMGGETIAINRGDLYRTRSLQYPTEELTSEGKTKYPRPSDTLNAWEGPEATFHSKTIPRATFDGVDYTYHNSEDAVARFDRSRSSGFADANGFELIRKSDDQLLSMRRIVYDNDHQSRTLLQRNAPPRWKADANGWAAAEPGAKEFRHTGPELSWLRYRHFAPRSREEWSQFGGNSDPVEYLSPVTNFLGYNAGLEDGRGEARNLASDFWVGDLILECQATFSDKSSIVLELSKGPHRYQATFQNGLVELARVGPQGRKMAEAPTRITTGSHQLRFANVDCRLRVWVDGQAIPFGDDANYAPDAPPEQFDPMDKSEEGFTVANDVRAPASIGVVGNIDVRRLVLWRDTYFTYSDAPFRGIARYTDTFYVQPDHYFVMGDNSAQSSDSRKWGAVPDRLMLGKASAIFFPINRIGVIE